MANFALFVERFSVFPFSYMARFRIIRGFPTFIRPFVFNRRSLPLLHSFLFRLGIYDKSRDTHLFFELISTMAHDLKFFWQLEDRVFFQKLARELYFRTVKCSTQSSMHRFPDSVDCQIPFNGACLASSEINGCVQEITFKV